MPDKTMDDIKSGKGLPPLPNNSGYGSQSGVIMEQRSENGITHEFFTYHGDKKSNNSNDNE